MKIITMPYCHLTDDRTIKLRAVLAKLTIGQILSISRCMPSGKNSSHAADRPAVEFQQVHQQVMAFLARAIDWYSAPFGNGGAVRERVDGCQCITLFIDGHKFPATSTLVDGLTQTSQIGQLLLDWAMEDCGNEPDTALDKKKAYPILRVKSGTKGQKVAK